MPERVAGEGAPALSVRGLGKRYGRGNVALDGVDLTVEGGELVGLLGPNGAGKSTLTKIACGLVAPSEGGVSVNGSAAGSLSARASIGYLAELFRFPVWLTAGELLELHQQLASSPGGRREREELLELVGLAEAVHVPTGEMSKGMQQRLGIAQALVGSPQLLLLDEPTSALDPAGRRLVRELLIELRGRGIAVLLNSHLLGEVERICDSVTIIDRGRVVAAGGAHELGGAGGVEIETASGVRRVENVERSAIPGIVRELVAAGESIYAVRETGSTLEDAYLAAVAEDHGTDGAPSR
ncbi:MAG TPA: ABC transporter ATP-binding protein [Solirubrobacterales bacterium]|nr:ABC transporter ATP-binding protein [Solirubrobacterales bacterium]